MQWDLDVYLGYLETLISIPSPTGFCDRVSEYTQAEIDKLGFDCRDARKGLLSVSLAGERPYTNGLTAHFDTLGAMVRSIDEDGSLRLSFIGRNLYSTLDGEYCTVHVREGEDIPGTILSNHPSAHVFDGYNDPVCEPGHLRVRLDRDVATRREVRELGISHGDFVSFDPRFVVTDSGYIKSRHLDNKAGVACLLMLLRAIRKRQRPLPSGLLFLFSRYEELGHGSAYLPEEPDELIGIDMGCVGGDLGANEKTVSICAMDSGGPYDYGLTTQLVREARAREIPFSTDVFPHYTSDLTAVMRAGHDCRCALIGFGLDASHGMERTHWEGIRNTLDLLAGHLGLD